MTTAQKAPCAIAARILVAKANSYPGANAVATFASAKAARATAITSRRSNRAVARLRGMLVTMTVNAHTEMSNPIWADDTPRSAESSGIRPAGSDSAVTVTSTPKLSNSRARRGNRETGADVWAAAVEVLMHPG